MTQAEQIVLHFAIAMGLTPHLIYTKIFGKSININKETLKASLNDDFVLKTSLEIQAVLALHTNLHCAL